LDNAAFKQPQKVPPYPQKSLESNNTPPVFINDIAMRKFTAEVTYNVLNRSTNHSHNS